jgi:hypothetical protein
MRPFILFILLFNTTLNTAIAQEFPYKIKIDSIEISELGGLQSFSVGQADGKWLIIGGRLDGLHRRQPFASFDSIGHNTQLLVVDPISKVKWSVPLTDLSINLQEQLSSTNMQFCQKNELLVLTGGYGYSPTAQDHKTFPYITFVNVPKVIDAIINHLSIAPYFQQIADEKFAVCGGQLQLVNEAFFLVGGHRFDGRYHPMNNSAYDQVYTSSIRKFTIETDGQLLKVNHQSEVHNEDYLRRRDFNLLPQILPNGEEGLIAFSGVFQKTVDLPYLNAVIIDADSFTVNTTFAQYYNHYHCAKISLYDSNYNNMHNLFFGGIAQYYDSLGFLVQDNDVPFVKTVARVSRDKNGWMQEFILPTTMPSYLGAASEFILNPSLPLTTNEVVKLTDLKEDTTLLGYIYGGIHSSAANIFWINTGIESSASNLIYPIYLIKDPSVYPNPNDHSTNSFQLQIYPNPMAGEVTISFTLPIESTVRVEIKNMMGEIAYDRTMKKVPAGEYDRQIKFKDLDRGEVYYLNFTVNGKTVTQKMLVH